MKGQHLGELEELVMLTIGTLHPKAYGVSIRHEIQESVNRTCTLSSIHAVLQRLEEKGFITGTFGEITPERGGKRKKYFEITQSGARLLAYNMEMKNQLWKQMPKTVLKHLST